MPDVAWRPEAGLDFVALTFALFKLGAVPGLIDPGMGRANLLHCVGRVRPEALIAIPAAHALRVLTRHKAFATVRVYVTVGTRWFWGGPTLESIRARGAGRGAFPIAATTTSTRAAILFTSGGTGPPKGVCYEHGMFGAQVEAIRSHFQIQPGEIDLPAFPLFALFSTALGTTCVIPDMNPSRPAQCNPDKLIDAIRKHKVTYSFGSPAIWKRVGPRCIERGVTLPSLKRILMAGAPVRGEVLAPFAKILAPGADVFIPYGATEALPVSSIRGSEVLNETWALTRQGKGHCVGRPLPGMTVKILPLGPPPSLAASAAPNEIGEIIVKGAVVTKEYFEMPEATAQAKIMGEPAARDGGGSSELWHRMGDMGYFDASGRLWFSWSKSPSRFAHANGRIFYSVCNEADFRRISAHEAGAGSARRSGWIRPGERARSGAGCGNDWKNCGARRRNEHPDSVEKGSLVGGNRKAVLLSKTIPRGYPPQCQNQSRSARYLGE